MTIGHDVIPFLENYENGVSEVKRFVYGTCTGGANFTALTTLEKLFEMAF